LTEEEVHKMFKKAEETNKIRDLKVLKILYYFGLRNNEMCNLDIEHINLDELTLKVVQGKGKKDRIIPIIEINPLPEEHKTIVDDLREWIGGEKKGILIEGDSANGRISDRHIRRIVKNYASQAKLRSWKEVHPHSLRHSYATHLANLGVPLPIIQKLMGHKKIDTTQIYAHLGVETLRNEIKKYVRIAQMKKEFPGILKKIEGERDPQRRITMQQDLIIKALMIQMGISPELS